MSSIGIVGATGAVGRELIDVLACRKFPIQEITLYASKRSIGKTMVTPYGDLTIKEFTVDGVRKMDIVFLSVTKEFALAYAPLIAAPPGGAIVIDNSSAFRYTGGYPLCIPEINPGVVRGHRIIANPNCTTAIAAVVLWPLHKKYKLKKVIVSSYQASSGAGAKGMKELKDGVKQVLAGNRCPTNVFSHPLAFNVIPHIDTFQENGYTKEEMKVVWEIVKIFGLDPNSTKISCTAVRVPTLRAHAEAITVEMEEMVSPSDARELLRTCAGIHVVDDPKQLQYPMPILASKQFDVQVGRIRQSLVFGDRGLDLFVCGDQLLKGAALNAVQIAETMQTLP